MKWIKIRDRLPEPYDSCLFFNPKYDQPVWIGWVNDLQDDPNREFSFKHCDDCCDYEDCVKIPTRWMPIPKEPVRRLKEERIYKE